MISSCLERLSAVRNSLFFNTEITIEGLHDRLAELTQAAKTMQAKADAENRDLNADEQKEIEGIFAAFGQTETEIERRKTLQEMSSRISAPLPRKADPEPIEVRNSAKPTKNGLIASAIEDRNKWGFRSAGEYLAAVVSASKRGGNIDPRLIANAPTTYGSEGIGVDGGFAVPPDFRSTIIEKVMGVDSLLARTDQQTSASNSITFPADETTPWQSSGGILVSWESEGGLKSQSKPALVEKTVKLNKLVSLIPMTDELLEDAGSMANYVNRKAPQKMTYAINNAIINGTGVGQPLGILNSAGTISVAAESGQAADTVRFENIVNMWGRLTPQARQNAVWLVNPDVETQMMQMQFPGTGTAVPVYLPPGGLSAAPYGTLLGRPVIPSEANPALGDVGDIILGDLSSYLTVVKGGGIRQDVSIHLFFDYDITAFRFVFRVGGQPWWNSPITAAQVGAATRGFFVTLATRS